MSAPDEALAPLRAFAADLTALVERTDEETVLLEEGARLLGGLIARDDWLPESHARPDAARYRQYALYVDPAARFSIVSFVWGPGQSTPVHDHRTWGLVGVLRGAEIAESFALTADGLASTGNARLEAGQVDRLSPAAGDVHRVSNAYADRVSISIHVYGADIGTVSRATYDAAGTPRPFVSAYADAPALPL